MNAYESIFSRMLFTAGRLVSTEDVVRRKVISWSGFDNMVNDFGYEKKGLEIRQ